MLVVEMHLLFGLLEVLDPGRGRGEGYLEEDEQSQDLCRVHILLSGYQPY